MGSSPRGSIFASHVGIRHLIVEGDSKIIISMFIKLFHGSKLVKIHPSWCLLGTLDTLKYILYPNLVIIPSHVPREENKVVDKLANVGVSNGEQDICLAANI
jgi:hypothetical protein